MRIKARITAMIIIPQTNNPHQVFSGIKSLLPIEMIPNGGLVKNTDKPIGDNISIITENEDLQ